MADVSDLGTVPARARPSGEDMQALGDGFRDASDAKLRKVTQLIDRMPNRGAADALLEPIRDRLATLRPVRHMNRTRLLFTPFDRVLVQPARWQPGSGVVPRSVLAPVMSLLDASDAGPLPSVPLFDAGDPAELLRCGRPLWDTAATALDGMTVAASRTDTERALPQEALEELVPVMAMVFRWAYTLRTLPPRSDPVLQSTLLGILTHAARSGPVGWSVMLTLLFDVASPDQVARLAGTIARGERALAFLRTGLDHAVTDLLGHLERAADPLANASADEPAQLLQRLSAMHSLAGLRGMENRPGFEQKRVSRLEQAMDAGSRTLFKRSLGSQLERFEAAMAGADRSPTGIETMLAIEADARRLRLFALGAAELDGGRDYDAMIKDMTASLAVGLAGESGATMVARLRLVELIAGSERAVQLASATTRGNGAASC